MKKTPQHRALEILKDHPDGITPGIFAEKMWPDAPGWDKVSDVGRGGAARGVGMRLAGGSYLARLANQSLAVCFFNRVGRKEYHITVAGVLRLRELNKEANSF